MNINRRIAAITASAALLLTGVISVVSQERQPAPGSVVVQRERTPQAPDGPPVKTFNENFVYVASEMNFEGLVKGAPYSAEGVTEVTQILTDGNRIVNRSTTRIYRDSEGRTRREQTLNAYGPFASGSEAPATIFISDPVAGSTYFLDTRNHTARRLPSFRYEWKPAPGEGAKVPGPAQGGKIRVMAAPDTAGAAGVAGGDKTEFVVRVPPPAEAPLPPGAVGQGGSRSAFMVKPPNPALEGGGVMEYRREEGRKPKQESLGKRSVEGVEAEGTRETVTIPAGEIGNERAIEIVNERWYSNELQTVVMTRHSDPRFGETVYRLTNINRGEQPKTLFEVPGDYAVKSPSTGVGAGAGSGAGGGTGIGGVVGGRTVATERAPISGGVLNGKAVSLPQPEYPAIARAANASGEVEVRILIDEDGSVVSAEAVSGHPLLRAAAVSAAREAKFSPTKLSGQPVKVQGVVLYNFENQ